MDYGKDTQNYTQIKTWYMLLALATIVKTGFMLKSLGCPQHLCHFLFLEFITLYSKHIVTFYFCRKKDSKTYQGTTWQIKFELKNIDKDHTYTLRVAIASATFAELQVRVNDANASPLFTSGLIGRDNSIARHGIHGLYWLFNVEVAGSKLVEGENTLFLTQPRSISPFQGIMYDYIRFEAPS